jgi:hypothetical protein
MNRDCPFDSDTGTGSRLEHNPWSTLPGRPDRLARIGASPDDYRLSGLSAQVGSVERSARRFRGAWIVVRPRRGDVQGRGRRPSVGCPAGRGNEQGHRQGDDDSPTLHSWRNPKTTTTLAWRGRAGEAGTSDEARQLSGRSRCRGIERSQLEISVASTRPLHSSGLAAPSWAHPRRQR